MKASKPASPRRVRTPSAAQRPASRPAHAPRSTTAREPRGHKADSNVTRANASDAEALTRLLHVSYAEHIAAGVNFTAGTQSTAQTLKDIRSREVYLVRRGSEIVATVMVTPQASANSRPRLYISHLAVDPKAREAGRGRRLLNFVERLAKRRDIVVLRLDTAKQLAPLIDRYQRRGYTPIFERQWTGKTYRSVMMEKELGPRRAPSSPGHGAPKR